MTEKKDNLASAASLLEQFSSAITADNLAEWLTKLIEHGIDSATAFALIEKHNTRLSSNLPPAPENPEVKIITDSRGHVGPTGPQNPAGRESNES